MPLSLCRLATICDRRIVQRDNTGRQMAAADRAYPPLADSPVSSFSSFIRFPILRPPRQPTRGGHLRMTVQPYRTSSTNTPSSASRPDLSHLSENDRQVVRLPIEVAQPMDHVFLDRGVRGQGRGARARAGTRGHPRLIEISQGRP